MEMLSETTERPAMTHAEHRAAFFRQSGWLMVASLAGGSLMWAVHFLSRRVGPREYGLFDAVYVPLLMCIPVAPLQTVMAQQTAKALATNQRGQLAALTRMVWVWTSVVWLVGAVAAWVLRDTLLSHWKITNPAGLWLAVVGVLFALWMPLFQGVLQGEQNFLWLGWSIMSNSIGRLGVATVAVLALGGLAAGMMTGVLAGMVVAVALAVWQTRPLWSGHAEPFDWRSVLRQVVPLFFACGAVQFLWTSDGLFVGYYFQGNAPGFYGSAGTLSRALMWFVLPMTTVMFPRLVHSSAKAEKTNIMGLVLGATAVLSIAGAAGLTVLGPWVIGIVNGPAFVKAAAPLLPWYAAAMIPLSLANVLVNALLARSSFRIVPWLCVLAVGYALALTHYHQTLVMVLQVLLLSNLALLAVCGWFSWRDRAVQTEALPAGRQ
jgi:O-antigen/teichoic acid export membrane protein